MPAASLRTSNPVLNTNIFRGLESFGQRSSVMTVQGAINKTAILFALLLAAAAWTWHLMATAIAGQVAPALIPWLAGGVIGGLIFGFATYFKPTWSPVTAPCYAVCEGLALGAISSVFNHAYQGIVIQAVALTFGVLAAMLVGYSSGFIRVTQKFRAGVVAATFAILLFYLATIILSWCGVNVTPVVGNGLLSIGISVFIVIIAALNLALDFDFIDAGANAQAPKYMEWYGAFGLMVTLVWLYIEILNLLAKMRSRN